MSAERVLVELLVTDDLDALLTKIADGAQRRGGYALVLGRQSVDLDGYGAQRLADGPGSGLGT